MIHARQEGAGHRVLLHELHHLPRLFPVMKILKHSNSIRILIRNSNFRSRTWVTSLILFASVICKVKEDVNGLLPRLNFNSEERFSSEGGRSG